MLESGIALQEAMKGYDRKINEAASGSDAMWKDFCAFLDEWADYIGGVRTLQQMYMDYLEQLDESCVYNEAFPWEYAAAAASGGADVSTLKSALKQFAKAYDGLCTAFYSEDPAIEDALHKVGFEYPFFAAPFEELGIDAWCANMLDALKAGPKSMGESAKKKVPKRKINEAAGESIYTRVGEYVMDVISDSFMDATDNLGMVIDSKFDDYDLDWCNVDGQPAAEDLIADGIFSLTRACLEDLFMHKLNKNEGLKESAKRKPSRKLNEGRWVHYEPTEDYPEQWYYCPKKDSNAFSCSITKRPGNKYGDRYEIRSAVGEAKPKEVLDSLEGAQAMAVKMFGESLKRRSAKRKIK